MKQINLEYLEMMTGDDLEMRQTMIAMLLEELPTEIGKMRPLVEQQNWHELKEISHKMKSTLAFVGNDNMINANREIERICKEEGQYSSLPSLVETLELEMPAVIAELETA